MQETDLQDDSIRELAGILREMLANANMIPDLLVISNATNVIIDISRQSLRVASIIHEYTKLSLAGDALLILLNSSLEFVFFAERTAKIQGSDLKSRIDKCQKECTTLKDSFHSRLNLDTNFQTKGISQTLNAIKDDKLGTFELHSYIVDNSLFKFTQRIRFASGWPHLTAPGIRMKRAINTRKTPAPGFSKGTGSVCGKKTLGFFGLRESVSFFAHPI